MQPSPPQWNLDPASLAKVSTEDLEKAIALGDQMQSILEGADRP